MHIPTAVTIPRLSCPQGTQREVGTSKNGLQQQGKVAQTQLHGMFAAAHPAVAPRSKVLSLPALAKYLDTETLSQPRYIEAAASDEEKKYPIGSSTACNRADSKTIHP